MYVIQAVNFSFGGKLERIISETSARFIKYMEYEIKLRCVIILVMNIGAFLIPSKKGRSKEQPKLWKNSLYTFVEKSFGNQLV